MMSALNYSKFDKIDYDAESDDENGAPKAESSSGLLLPAKVHSGNGEQELMGAGAAPSLGVDGKPLPTKMTGKTKEGRLKFEYQGRTIYEWEQSLDEVNIYLNPPPGLPAKLIDISITHTHLKIGVVNTPPFIDEDLGGPVKVDECTWTLVDGELNITLCKMNKAETWTKALYGKDGAEVDPVTKEEERKKMMLERFQEEVSAVQLLSFGDCYTLHCFFLFSLLLFCLVRSIRGSISPVPTLMGRFQRLASLWVVSRDELSNLEKENCSTSMNECIFSLGLSTKVVCASILIVA